MAKTYEQVDKERLEAKQMCNRLRNALACALSEAKRHNASSRYITTEDKIAYWKELIEL